jgi:hypothetical protein
MSKAPPSKTNRKVASHEVDVSSMIAAFETEHRLISDQQAEIRNTLKSIEKSGKWAYDTEESWEHYVEITEAIAKDLDQQLTYLERQIAVLKKAQRAFASDDPKKIKAALKDYLETDVDLSLKNMALVRYDTEQLLISMRAYDEL